MNILRKLQQRWKNGDENLISLLVRPLTWLNVSYHFSRKYAVLEDTWDYLIILDACRFDTFKKINTIPGKLSKKTSKGTHTVEWSKKNFEGNNCSDIIYISGNPQVSHYKVDRWQGGNPFRKLVDLWVDDWSDNYGTVMPDVITKATIKEIEQNDRKDVRFIMHYLQPHYPFVGKIKPKTPNPDNKSNISYYRYVQKTEGSLQGVIKAYESNLEYILPYIEDLIKHIPKGKKIVVTADHGEVFGEWGIHSHPPYIYLNELVTVPYLEVRT